MSYYWTTFGTFQTTPGTTVIGIDPANTSHTIIQDIGTNTHDQIDTFISYVQPKIDQDVTITSSPTFASINTSTITNTGTLTLPSTTGTIALVSDIPSPSSYVTTNTTQNITGAKTFLTAPAISSISNTGTLTLPTTTGTIALTSDIPSLSNYVTTNTTQSISGVKTFLTPPTISTISNTGTLTLPTTTGTIALTSDIPSLANYVTTNTAQNITGVKTFLTAPTISTISNTGTLTLPTITGTLALTSDIPSLANYVTTNTAQVISAVKTFNANPEISAITKSGNTITLPLATTTLVGQNTVDTLVNKTIDTTNNDILITSTPLVSANINGLVNQDVRTTASPSFVTVSPTNQVNVQTTNTSGVLINQALNVAQNTNGLTVQSGGVTKLFIGHNQSIDLSYISAAPGLRILTSSTERLRIPAAGIALDNTATSLLALQGTTLVSRNNIVDLTSTQTLTNKTLTAPAISTISNTGTLTLPTTTDTLVGRATVDTLTNKTIQNLNATGSTSSFFSGNYLMTRVTATTVGAVAVQLAAIAVPNNTVIQVELDAWGYCTASSGADLNKVVLYASEYGTKNVASVMTTYTLVNTSQRDGAFGGATITITTASTNLIINCNGIAGDTISWAGTLKVTY